MEFIAAALILFMSLIIMKEQKKHSDEKASNLEFYGLLFIALFMLLLGVVSLAHVTQNTPGMHNKEKILAATFFLEMQARLLIKTKLAKNKDEIDSITRDNFLLSAYSIGVIPKHSSWVSYLVLALMGIQALTILSYFAE